jgi:protein SCO1
MEPDKMLAEKDPLAMDLLAKYNNLPMPNMRLNNKDAQALLDYLEEESHRIEHQRHHHHPAPAPAGHDNHDEHQHGDHEHGVIE